MHSPKLILLATIAIAACTSGEPDATAIESTTTTPAAPDSTAVAQFRDTATATIATLLERPASARFDSVVVTIKRSGFATMTVCGRVAGSPGINGSNTPTRFIYQSRWTVFVEESRNLAQFNEVWSRSCTADSTLVVTHI